MTSAPTTMDAELPPSGSLKFLVIRPDRIGDVILSTPVFEALKSRYPKAEITAMVRPEVAPLIRGLPSVDRVLVYEPEQRHRGLRGLRQLIQDIRAGDFRVAIALQSQRRVALATFAAGVRFRIGPWSKPHSFALYNRGVRQKRSDVDMHETDYNLQLLKRLGISVSSRTIPVRVALDSDALNAARAWLEKQGWSPGVRLAVVHPGMGGSALNWPESHYGDLVRDLVKTGKQVLLTCGPGETDVLRRVLGGASSERLWVYEGDSTLGVAFLAGLFAHASVVVAPSTGPLHVAVALGKSVVTFYPPIRVQSALRWGPYLPVEMEDAKSAILVPDVYCGQDFVCRGEPCHYYPCMKSLSVGQALSEADRLLEGDR